MFIHSAHSFGVGMSVGLDANPVVWDENIRIMQGSPVYSKSAWQFMLDKQAERGRKLAEREEEKKKAKAAKKEADRLAKSTEFYKPPEEESEEEEEEDDGADFLDEPQQDALDLPVSFAGRLEYSLQALAFAEM